MRSIPNFHASFTENFRHTGNHDENQHYSTTGKTISEMLSELDAVDVSIDQSDFRLRFEMYLPDDLKVAENCQMLCMAHNRAKRIR